MSPRTGPQPRTIEVRLRRGRKESTVIREYTIPATVNGRYAWRRILHNPNDPCTMQYLSSFGYTERNGRPGRWTIAKPVLPSIEAVAECMIVAPDEDIDAWSDEEEPAAAAPAPRRALDVPHNVLREIN